VPGHGGVKFAADTKAVIDDDGTQVVKGSSQGEAKSRNGDGRQAVSGFFWSGI
jgi:hypothetical protein